MTSDFYSRLDDDFKRIGEFGPYQLCMLILIGLTTCTTAIFDYSYVFTGATPDYRYGRKFCVYCLLVMNAVSYTLIAVLTNFEFSVHIKMEVYGALNLLSGISSDVFSVVVVLAIELIGPSYRCTAANAMNYFYLFGQLLIGFVSYGLRDFDRIYLCYAVIIWIFPVYFWIVPDSPRWMLMQGKHNEANRVLSRIARSNRKEFAYNMVDFDDNDENQSLVEDADNPIDDSIEPTEATQPDTTCNELDFVQTIKRILTTRKLFFLSIAIGFNWITNTFVYYGLTLGNSQLEGNPYVNFLFLTISELFSTMTSQYFFDRHGRKKPYVIAMTTSGISLMIIYFIPASSSYWVNILAMIGKFAISFTLNGMYIITSELYPTIIRGTVVCLFLCLANFGSIVVPYVNLFADLYWRPFPFVLYGTCSILASILIWAIVPETQNTLLADNLPKL